MSNLEHALGQPQERTKSQTVRQDHEIPVAPAVSHNGAAKAALIRARAYNAQEISNGSNYNNGNNDKNGKNDNNDNNDSSTPKGGDAFPRSLLLIDLPRQAALAMGEPDSARSKASDNSQGSNKLRSRSQSRKRKKRSKVGNVKESGDISKSSFVIGNHNIVDSSRLSLTGKSLTIADQLANLSDGSDQESSDGNRSDDNGQRMKMQVPNNLADTRLIGSNRSAR